MNPVSILVGRKRRACGYAVAVGRARRARRTGERIGQRLLAWVVPPTLSLLVGCSHKQQGEPSQASGPVVRVQSVQVQPQTVPDVYDAVGTVRPRVSATVAPKVMAAILEIPVRTGDAVRAGDVLARLDDRELRARFEQAEADYKRFTALLERESVTRAEYDGVEARYRVAKAAVSDATITAPFQGVVAEKFCDAGDLAAPGKPMFAIEQTGDFRLEAVVPDRFARAVRVGEQAQVVVEATGDDCDGAIGEVVPASDPSSRSFLVKVDLHCHQPLKSGLFGRAQLVVGKRTGLFVPKSAVRERGQLTFVFVDAAGRAQMRLVKTGQTRADQIELLSGIQPGERLIVSAQGELIDGQPIQP